MAIKRVKWSDNSSASDDWSSTYVVRLHTSCSKSDDPSFDRSMSLPLDAEKIECFYHEWVSMLLRDELLSHHSLCICGNVWIKWN